MSILQMDHVWRSALAPSAKLVALAMADWAADDGTRVYPSMSKLATKVGLSTDQTRRIVRGFERMGYAVVVANSIGGAPGATRRYRLDPERLPTASAHARGTAGMDARGKSGQTACMGDGDGLHGCKGTAGAHASLSVKEPLGTVKRESAQARATPARKSSSTKTALPEDFAISAGVRDWAYREGIPGGDLRKQFDVFVSKALAGGYLKANWDEAFKVAVQQDWAQVRPKGDAGLSPKAQAAAGFGSSRHENARTAAMLSGQLDGDGMVIDVVAVPVNWQQTPEGIAAMARRHGLDPDRYTDPAALEVAIDQKAAWSVDERRPVKGAQVRLPGGFVP